MAPFMFTDRFVDSMADLLDCMFIWIHLGSYPKAFMLFSPMFDV